MQKLKKGSEFIFDFVYLLYYECHEINPNHGESYIDSPEWIKNKETVNPIIRKDICFQYAVTVVLNHEEIKKDPQRIVKIKPFINKYNWKGINVLSEKDDWKKSEKIIVKTTYPAYISKHNSNCESKLLF